MFFQNRFRDSQRRLHRDDSRRCVSHYLGYESLEVRRLLTTIPFEEAFPESWDRTVTQATAQYPAEDGKLSEDGQVKFEYESDGNEFVVFKIYSGQFAEPTDLKILDPAGKEQVDWVSYVGDNRRILVGGTTAPTAGKTTLVLENVESWAEVTAYRGLTFLPNSEEAPVPIDVTQTTEEWQPRSEVVAGILEATVPQPVLYEYEIETLATEDWVERIDGNGSVEFGSELVVSTGESPSPDVFVDGVLIEYESATGNLRFKSHPSAKLTTFELKSPSNWFQGERPDVMAENVFNVFRADKIFVLSLGGTGEVDFGRILPPGLSRSELESELQFDGSNSSGGRPGVVSYSIDGDITIDSENSPFRVLSRPSNVTAVRAITAHKPATITFDYKWDGPPTSDLRPSGYRTYASFRSNVDGLGGSRDTLEGCVDWCHFEASLPRGTEYFLDSESVSTVEFAFQNVSTNTDLVVRDLKVLGRVPATTQSFSIPVHANHGVRIRIDTAADVQVLDVAGNLVTTSHRFKLPASDEGIENYQLQISSNSASYLLNAESVHPAGQVNPQKPATRIENNYLFVSWDNPIDLRTCGLSDFHWDGPAFETFDVRVNGRVQVRLGLSATAEPGHYELNIRDGACVDLYSGQPAEPNVTVDFMPPEIVEIPIAESQWMKTGDGLIAIRFNEAVRALPTEIQLKKANSTGSFSTHVRIEDYFVEYHGEFLLIDLGELEAGEYFADVSFFASDSSGNESEQSQLSLTFVVSDTPLSGVAFNRFDVDQNGTVDRSDLNLLIDWSGRNHLSTNSNRDDVPARFDLNSDGLIDELDKSIFVREGLKSPIGDVDLDGDFDQDDLDILAALARDGYYGALLIDNSIPYGDFLWTAGDFNGDGWFDSADLVAAFSALDSKLESGEGSSESEPIQRQAATSATNSKLLGVAALLKAQVR